MGTTLPAVYGRINDLDSHLPVPISRCAELVGDATARFGARFAGIPLFDATDEPELTTGSVSRPRARQHRAPRRPRGARPPWTSWGSSVS